MSARNRNRDRQLWLARAFRDREALMTLPVVHASSDEQLALEVLRKITQIHEPILGAPEVAFDHCRGCGNLWPCQTVREVASVFATMSGYQDLWN